MNKKDSKELRFTSEWSKCITHIYSVNLNALNSFYNEYLPLANKFCAVLQGETDAA